MPLLAKKQEFCARRSPYVNPLANSIEQNKLASVKSPAKKANIKSKKASTKAPASLKALILPLLSLSIKNVFTKFIKVFIELI